MKKTIQGQPIKVSVQVSGQISHPEAFKDSLEEKNDRRLKETWLQKSLVNFFYEKVADMNIHVDELVFGNQTSCQSRGVLKNAAYEYNVQNVVHNDPLTELIIIKHAIRDTDFTSSEVKGYIHSTNLDSFSASLYTGETVKNRYEMTKKVF